jgi:ectoine hydroxylase-related dioxygenase (phytanoyl-CoA dioxygenase family)
MSIPQADTSHPTHDLTEAVEQFRRQGFVVLPRLFHGAELAALQREAAAQIDAGADRGPKTHFRTGTSADGKEVLFRIEAVAAKGLTGDATLRALAHPELLAMASALLGGSMVCWSDALLWKGPEGGAEVAMHSGHGWNDVSTTYENLVVDVYLDEATPANGCLKVVPGSHLLTADENRALIGQGLDAPGTVDVILEPGDVLFHSEWMVHGSAATAELGRATRRILYFAFRDPAVFAPTDAPVQQRAKVAACLRRMQIARERRAAEPYDSGEAPFAWAVPTGWAEEAAAVSADDAVRVGFFADVIAG